MLTFFRFLKTVPLVAAVMLTTHPAFAQLMKLNKGDAGWADPIVKLIQKLNSGAGRVGSVLVFLALACWAIKNLIPGERGIEWREALGKVFLGLFIFYAPEIVEGLLGK